jgi:REP element-mobilizing transposase RayT
MHPVYHRRSIRLKGYDYTQAGAYSVTLVSRHRECIFGEVEEDQVHLNPIGIIIEASWKNLEHNFPIILDKWVIMPNHFHGIIFLDPNRTGEALANRRMNRSESKMANASPQRPIGTQSVPLGQLSKTSGPLAPASSTRHVPLPYSHLAA